jgi:diaminopimelate decarboxylase
VRYVEGDPEISIGDNINAMASRLKACCKKHGIDIPAVMLEPGRSIVADAGITLYTVGNIKEIPGYKNYIAVDGGMTDNPRYALYGSKYTVVNIPASASAKSGIYPATIAGRLCESGDIIQENISLSKPQRGDLIAVLGTGAYNYSMASNYNRLPRPALVIVDSDGTDRLAVRRETLEDVAALDIMQG